MVTNFDRDESEDAIAGLSVLGFVMVVLIWSDIGEVVRFEW